MTCEDHHQRRPRSRGAVLTLLVGLAAAAFVRFSGISGASAILRIATSRTSSRASAMVLAGDLDHRWYQYPVFPHAGAGVAASAGARGVGPDAPGSAV